MTVAAGSMRLLSPLRVGAHLLKNRVVMASMHTRLEHLDRAMEREIAYYRERALGGVGLIVTSGFSPNAEGRMEEGCHVLDSAAQALLWRPLTDAVHAAGSKIVLQILHAGRYAKHALAVAPCAVRAPINAQVPRAMDEADIARTIADFVRCAELAQQAGFDGVEVMASEGYLINEFTAERTNQRTDRWGGSRENRCRFAQLIVAGIRAACGADFLMLYRISAVDLVEQGRAAEDIVYEAQLVEAAGVDALDTGIGWHEARVPTIAYHVPRAAFRYAPARLKQAVGIPVIASNRINTPEVAEDILAAGDADLVAMARPLLADPQFVIKVEQGRTDEINTCIACNQACLDFIFSGKTVGCLVNPRAGRELDFNELPRPVPRRIAVVGAGPAGLSCAIEAARLGHAVTLYESAGEIGGQLKLAARIPGKGEFHELLRYFRRQLEVLAIDTRLGVRVGVEELAAGAYDQVVIAAGIVPRQPDFDGVSDARVLSYLDVIEQRVVPGQRVAIIGAGGIAHDVAELLLHEPAQDERAAFFTEWGVDPAMRQPGGLSETEVPRARRSITLLQRGTGRPGASLGVSTGWILRARLQRRGLRVLSGCSDRRLDEAGLHVRVAGQEQLLAVDHVVVCAGQEPATELSAALSARGMAFERIGGARSAAGLDAWRAIGDGARLAGSF